MQYLCFKPSIYQSHISNKKHFKKCHKIVSFIYTLPFHREHYCFHKPIFCSTIAVNTRIMSPSVTSLTAINRVITVRFFRRYHPYNVNHKRHAFKNMILILRCALHLNSGLSHHPHVAPSRTSGFVTEASDYDGADIGHKLR